VSAKRVAVGAGEAADHWEMLSEDAEWGRRWVELLHDGWVVASWMFSASAAQWFQSRRPRADDPAIPPEVLASAQALMTA